MTLILFTIFTYTPIFFFFFIIIIIIIIKKNIEVVRVYRYIGVVKG